MHMHSPTPPTLDPSTRCVICGAEPIRVEVMHSFYDYFKPCGFDPKTLMPSYGLAEFTLCATSQPSGRPLNILWVDQQVLGAEGKVVVVEEDTPGSACYVGVGGPFVKDGALRGCVAACKSTHLPVSRRDPDIHTYLHHTCC